MKFLPKKGAPDIPLELLEVQESGRLAFFCGAGISYPAGLPGIKGLVDQIYSELGATEEPLEKAAKRQRLYDRVLELVERRHHKAAGKANPMRESLTKLPDIPKGTDLATHKALLHLASSPTGGKRLITTNFDHGFLLTDPSDL